MAKGFPPPKTGGKKAPPNFTKGKATGKMPPSKPVSKGKNLA